MAEARSGVCSASSIASIGPRPAQLSRKAPTARSARAWPTDCDCSERGACPAGLPSSAFELSPAQRPHGQRGCCRRRLPPSPAGPGARPIQPPHGPVTDRKAAGRRRATNLPANEQVGLENRSARRPTSWPRAPRRRNWTSSATKEDPRVHRVDPGVRPGVVRGGIGMKPPLALGPWLEHGARQPSGGSTSGLGTGARAPRSPSSSLENAAIRIRGRHPVDLGCKRPEARPC